VDDADNIQQLVKRIFEKTPDLVEFRLDRVRDLHVLERIGKMKTFPAIATDKSNRGSVEKEKTLLTAAASGFEYIDVDATSATTSGLVHRAKAFGSKVIASFHDYSGTPALGDLKEILRSEQKGPGDLFKIVTTAQHPRDNLTVLGLLESKPPDTKLISFAMGSLGVPSRVLSPLFGAEFTFAALSDNSATADGQLSIDKLRGAWQSLGLQ
jgi:3-dehydroquinate dehydratase type I